MKTKIILISLVMVCLFGFIGSAAWQPRAFSVKGASTTAASNGNAASALVNTFKPHPVFGPSAQLGVGGQYVFERLLCGLPFLPCP